MADPSVGTRRLLRAIIVIALASTSAAGPSHARPVPRRPVGAAPTAGTAERFALLSQQTSNRCSLQPGELMTYPPGRRLQGSCCFAMSAAAYRRQITALRPYASIPQIPADPYDIPTALAQQLIGYQQTIHLTTAQQHLYATAMRATKEKGPCCCRCWRWTAFQGLADYLITTRGWQAPQLAALIGDLDGCGGSDDDTDMTSPEMSPS
jgi:hypothetical protein